jgi:hypothetical protein
MSPCLMSLNGVRYPFADMRIGDSFLIKDEDLVKNARSAAWMFGRRHGQEYSCRRVAEGWRVWRLA